MHACNIWAFIFLGRASQLTNHKDAVQDQIKEGVGMLVSLACQMLDSHNRAPTRMLLPPPHQDSSDAATDDEGLL